MASSSAATVQLFPDLKPVVWSLKIVGKAEKETISSACGFCVRDGMIMTCASLFTDFDSNKMEIRARRFDQDTFVEAELGPIRKQWDLALLKIEADDCKCGVFSQEGLYAGQPILYIGRSSHFIGSCRYGNVAFGCANRMSVPSVKSNMTCENYVFDEYISVTTQPSSASNMGCFWNKMFFASQNASDYLFEKQLHPHVPVIHCDRFSNNNKKSYGNPESPGSPVFYLNGNIVGMLSSKFENYDIAVHVSALHRFLTNSNSITQGSFTKGDPIKGNPTKGRRAAKRLHTE